MWNRLKLTPPSVHLESAPEAEAPKKEREDGSCRSSGQALTTERERPSREGGCTEFNAAAPPRDLTWSTPNEFGGPPQSVLYPAVSCHSRAAPAPPPRATAPSSIGVGPGGRPCQASNLGRFSRSRSSQLPLPVHPLVAVATGGRPRPACRWRRVRHRAPPPLVPRRDRVAAFGRSPLATHTPHVKAAAAHAARAASGQLADPPAPAGLAAGEHRTTAAAAAAACSVRKWNLMRKRVSCS
jgi:hypothetical protein